MRPPQPGFGNCTHAKPAGPTAQRLRIGRVSPTRSRRPFLILLAGLALVCLSFTENNAVGESVVLSNVAELHRVAQPEPMTAQQIQLEGTVWYADAAARRLVLSDASGAVPIEADWNGPLPVPGLRIRLSGFTSVETTGFGLQLGRPSPLIDNTGLRTVNEKSRSIYLTAGKHPIELDYFIIHGLSNRAVLELTYEGPETPRQRIPEAALFPGAGVSGRGLECQYYEGFWETLPDFGQLTPVKSGRVKNFDFSLAERTDQAGLRFRGQIEISRPGRYTFYLRSRDGSKLSVGAPPLRWDVMGTESFPPPQKIAIGQLLDKTNRFWAEVSGDVSFATDRPGGGVSLELCDGGGCLHVESTDPTLTAQQFIKKSLRIRGYCEGALDTYGRRIAGLMLVPGRKEIEWLASSEASGIASTDTNAIPPLLTTIQAVRRLNPELARTGLPLKVRGVVTGVQADHDAFTIQDMTGGLYVINSPETRTELPQVREFVEVEGVSVPGIARAHKITRLGWGVMPEPIHPAWDQLMSGSLDTRYVEIRGVIYGFTHRKNGWTRVHFRTRDGSIALDLRRESVRPGTIEDYQGAVIRLRGCLFGSWDLASGRVKAAQIRMTEVEVFVDEPAGFDLFSLPTQRVTALTRFDPEGDPFRRAKVTGQIICVNQGEYFLQDGEEGARVTLSDNTKFEVGDVVEVVGFPTLTGAKLYLRGAVARKLGHEPLPPAKRLNATEVMRTTHDATRICVEGVLAGLKLSTNELTLEVQVGPWYLLAHLKTNTSPPLRLRPGSTVELTGTYSDVRTHLVMGGDFTAIDLLVESPMDIRVLATPPWWNLRRLTYVVGGLGFLAAVMFLWLTQLRHQVEQRTREVRALNRDLQDRARALEAANKELESFSYSVSHDLRAPLRSMDGFSRALLEDYAAKLDAEGKEYLHTIRAASQRMGQLIDDMLMLAKVARTPIRREEFDLSALAGEVAQALRDAQPERRVEFVISPGLRAEGDASLTRIALENLLGNAWKFTSKQPAARIEFGRTNQNGSTAFFVRDNGVGFDMTYANKLFGAFQRLHTTAEFPGTGVGLASTQRIITRQGGRIWAASQPGLGATFFFTLPTETSA